MPNEGPWRGADLLFDIDYIVAWIKPEAPGGNFAFEVAPATLVFEDVWNVSGDLDNPDNADLEVADLHRGDLLDTDPARWLWRLEGHRFDVRFEAGGFRQHFRRWPVRVERQSLTREQRGRPSFDCPTELSAR
jgi:hypothetical protein